MDKRHQSDHVRGASGADTLAPISGASRDMGLVVRASDFLAALESPDVQETLACADQIRRSPDFPPSRAATSGD
jgi:hypothetical protein